MIFILEPTFIVNKIQGNLNLLLIDLMFEEEILEVLLRLYEEQFIVHIVFVLGHFDMSDIQNVWLLKIVRQELHGLTSFIAKFVKHFKFELFTLIVQKCTHIFL